PGSDRPRRSASSSRGGSGDARARAVTAPRRPHLLSSARPEAMNLLIADDDRVLTHLLSVRLRALGWKVTIAFDAMQALMFAMRSHPDAILLDIDMPGGTGVEAIRKLKVST